MGRASAKRRAARGGGVKGAEDGDDDMAVKTCAMDPDTGRAGVDGCGPVCVALLKRTGGSM